MLAGGAAVRHARVWLDIAIGGHRGVPRYCLFPGRQIVNVRNRTTGGTNRDAGMANQAIAADSVRTVANKKGTLTRESREARQGI